MQGDIILVEIKFGANQTIFVLKSVVKALYGIRKEIILRSFDWSELLGWRRML